MDSAEAALLKAVADDMGAEEPLLALAAYYAERQDPRGESILAHWKFNTRQYEGSEESAALYKRCQQLQPAASARWRPSWMIPSKLMWMEYSWGVPTTLCLCPKDIPRYLKRGLDDVPTAKRLKIMSSRTPPRHYDLRAITAIKDLARVEALSHANTNAPYWFLEMLLSSKQLRSIRQLELSMQPHMNDATLKVLAQNAALQRLDFLRVHLTEIGDDGCIALLRSHCRDTLSYLQIGECPNISARGVSALTQLPNIRHLDLDALPVNASHLEVLSEHPTLQSLDIHFMILTEEMTEALLNGAFASLKQLRFSKERIENRIVIPDAALDVRVKRLRERWPEPR